MSATQTSDKPDVIEFLEQQHEEIKRLFQEVETAAQTEKAETFQCLVRLLAVHETAEEELIHPEARRSDAAGSTVDERVGEESDAKAMLADLEKMGVEHADFDTKLSTFRAALLRHAELEETTEFPLLREVHDEKVLTRMTAELKAAEAMAPTHPHPHGPDGAVGNMLVGPFVAVADRVRDAIRST